MYLPAIVNNSGTYALQITKLDYNRLKFDLKS